MVGKALKSHGTSSELNSVFGLEKVDRWNPIRTLELRGKKFRSDERSAARFREVGGAL
jgi:hypothetical protein